MLRYDYSVTVIKNHVKQVMYSHIFMEYLSVPFVDFIILYDPLNLYH